MFSPTLLCNFVPKLHYFYMYSTSHVWDVCFNFCPDSLYVLVSKCDIKRGPCTGMTRFYMFCEYDGTGWLACQLTTDRFDCGEVDSVFNLEPLLKSMGSSMIGFINETKFQYTGNPPHHVQALQGVLILSHPRARWQETRMDTIGRGRNWQLKGRHSLHTVYVRFLEDAGNGRNRVA